MAMLDQLAFVSGLAGATLKPLEEIMGWLFSTRWMSRDDMVAHLRRPERYGETHELLHSSVVGNHHWYLCKRKSDGSIFIGLDLMQGSKPGYPGWGYKDLDESVGPCELDCPIRFLARASEPTGHAIEWREQVRAFHKRKASRPKPVAGLVVRCGDHEYKLVRPIAPRRGWYVDRVSDRHPFRMSAGMLGRALMNASPSVEPLTQTDAPIDADVDTDADDDVAEWVGLHYKRNFDACSDADKSNWRDRYRETQKAIGAMTT